MRLEEFLIHEIDQFEFDLERLIIEVADTLELPVELLQHDDFAELLEIEEEANI